jgi:hypothetical protein
VRTKTKTGGLVRKEEIAWMVDAGRRFQFDPTSLPEHVGVLPLVQSGRWCAPRIIWRLAVDWSAHGIVVGRRRGPVRNVHVPFVAIVIISLQRRWDGDGVRWRGVGFRY